MIIHRGQLRDGFKVSGHVMTDKIDENHLGTRTCERSDVFQRACLSDWVTRMLAFLARRFNKDVDNRVLANQTTVSITYGRSN